MTTMLFALLLFPLLQSDSGAPVGRPEMGRTMWNSLPPGTGWCRNCHGNEGQGAYGPDLAGRGLSFAEFKHAVRKPWGVMPVYNDKQISDQTLADFYSWLMSLPKVAEPGEWHEPLPPAGSPRGQFLIMANGCGQCHDRELWFPRTVLGGEASEVDYEYFSKRIYEHNELYPTGRMGNFSRLRLPESVLHEIFDFAVKDLGLLPPLSAALRPGVPSDGDTTYTLTLTNRGTKGKGLTAEDITISLALSPAFKVVKGTGTGYVGFTRDPVRNADAVIWKVPSLAPGETQTYTVTLSGTGGAANEVFKGSIMRFGKPEMRKGVPNLAYRDDRLPGKEAQIAVTFPPAAAPAQR